MSGKLKQRRWTDDYFEAEVREASSLLGHFPTNSELLGMQRSDLSNEIVRRGGFIHCAQMLNIPRLHSDSDTGWEGERAAATRLSELGFEVTASEGVRCPFDLLIENVLRVDVKATRLMRYDNSTGWFYRLGKQPQADLILLWQLDQKNYYALPWYVCPTTNITISRGGGKYLRFLNNDGIIREMVEMRVTELKQTQLLFGQLTKPSS